VKPDDDTEVDLRDIDGLQVPARELVTHTLDARRRRGREAYERAAQIRRGLIGPAGRDAVRAPVLPPAPSPVARGTSVLGSVIVSLVVLTVMAAAAVAWLLVVR
jgi:hypothetical protein